MHEARGASHHLTGPEYFYMSPPSVSTYVNAALTLSPFFTHLAHNAVQFDGRSQHYTL